MEVWKMSFLFKGVISRFHVSFGEVASWELTYTPSIQQKISSYQLPLNPGYVSFLEGITSVRYPPIRASKSLAFRSPGSSNIIERWQHWGSNFCFPWIFVTEKLVTLYGVLNSWLFRQCADVTRNDFVLQIWLLRIHFISSFLSFSSFSPSGYYLMVNRLNQSER